MALEVDFFSAMFNRCGEMPQLDMLYSVIDFLESPLGLWIRVVPYLFLSLYLLRSGVWPNREEPRKWHDRAIRILGGILFGSSALFGGARIMGWVR